MVNIASKEKREKKPNGYWTYENCYNEAKKHSDTKDFRIHSGSAYSTAHKNGWIKDYTWLENSTTKSNKNRIIWNYESCYTLAKQCTSKSDMNNKNERAYKVAHKNNWFKDYTWFTTTEDLRKAPRPDRVKWSYDKALEIAKKYKLLSEFEKENKSLYTICNRKGWIENFDWLSRGLNKFQLKDNVYAYIFKEFKTVYVGRTIHPQERHMQHCGKDTSAVYKFSFKKNIPIPNMTILISNITIEEGLIKENEFVEIYRKNGWNVLNKAKTGAKSGSVGGLSRKWNKSSCKKEALKYTTLKEFRKKSASAYNVSTEKNWIEDYYWLKRSCVKPNYWTYENCYNEAKKYTRRIDFGRNSPSAYDKSLKMHWINDYTWLSPSKTSKKWNYETCYNNAKKCTLLKDFITKYGCAYKIARLNGWINDYTWLTKTDISNKKVAQYDLKGNLIKIWDSVRECNRNGFTHSSVSQCCNNKYYHNNHNNIYKGYLWKFI